MITYKTVTREEQEPESVTCNKCGGTGSHAEHAGVFAHFKHQAGYGSVFDNDHFSFDLCERCLFAFFQTFVVPVEFSTNDYTEERKTFAEHFKAVEDYLNKTEPQRGDVSKFSSL